MLYWYGSLLDGYSIFYQHLSSFVILKSIFRGGEISYGNFLSLVRFSISFWTSISRPFYFSWLAPCSLASLCGLFLFICMCIISFFFLIESQLSSVNKKKRKNDNPVEMPKYRRGWRRDEAVLIKLFDRSVDMSLHWLPCYDFIFRNWIYLCSWNYWLSSFNLSTAFQFSGNHFIK